MFNDFVCFIRFYDAAFATALNQGLPNHAWWHDVHVNVRSLVSVEGCVQEVLPSVGTVTYHKDEAQHPHQTPSQHLEADSRMDSLTNGHLEGEGPSWFHSTQEVYLRNGNAWDPPISSLSFTLSSTTNHPTLSDIEKTFLCSVLKTSLAACRAFQWLTGLHERRPLFPTLWNSESRWITVLAGTDI